MDGEEVPYAMVSAMRGNMLFSNKGVRLDDLGGGRFASEYSTGKLGYPAGKGTSSFIQAYDGQNLSFWSGETRRLMYTSGSDMEEIKYKDGYEGVKVDWEQAAPVASGWNHRAGKNTIWYLFDVAGEGRYVVMLQPGGEKQRICIARAILKDSPIIIFDEATSFADMENEHKIQLALSCLLKGKTTIMIAHRLHTITGADQICVFHEGRLLEKGKHDELVSKGGRYADMWRSYTQEVTA